MRKNIITRLGYKYFCTRKLLSQFLLGSLCILFTACPKGDEPEPEPTPNPPAPIENNGGGNSVNIEEIISENVSVNVESKYYTFVVDLYTYLTDAGKYFAGRTDITYGIEWSYSNRLGQSYVYHIDPRNNFMRTTKVSSNHYSVIVSVFNWVDDDYETTFMNLYNLQYYGLKEKEKQETLNKDEKDLLKETEEKLKSHISEIYAFRGKVFVEIDGRKYYICSFQK